MAKDEKKDEKSAEPAAEGAEAADGGKKKRLIMIGGIIAVVAIGGGAAAFFMIGGGDKKTESHGETVAAEEHGEAKTEGHGEGDEKKAAAEHGEKKADEKAAEGHGEKKEGEKAAEGHGEKKEGEGHGGGEGKGEKKAEVKKDVELADFGKTYDMKTFHLNLGNPLENHYVRIEVSLEYSGGEDQKAEIEARLPQLRDAVVSIVSRKTREFLLAPDGKNQLRKEILTRINRYMTKPIKSVFITDLLIE